MLKYPRIKHLFGSQGSRDDLFLSKEETEILLRKPLVVQEKLDGANVGLFFEGDELKFLSRGGLIEDKKTPEQFKYLKMWAYERYMVLKEILNNRYILFGEWLYFTHTIFYNKLPSYFIAFDLYDKESEKFLSYNKIIKILGNKIPVVPLIWEGIIGSIEKLDEFLERKSLYGEEKIEGVVLREENKEYLIERYKYKRKAFKPGLNFGKKHNILAL